MKIAITGAAGTIGSELCKEYAGLNDIVYAIDTNEHALYMLALDIPVVPILQDVRDAAFWKAFYQKNKIDLVINCAACKQLPLVEAHPFHAMMVNGFSIAAMYNPDVKIVHISTDKAVYPVSLYGFSKYIAEEQAKRLDIPILRLVNVYGSSGSVVEVFEKQVADGGPLTVTDPHMIRHFTYMHEVVPAIAEMEHLRHGVYMLERYYTKSIHELATGYADDHGCKIKITGIRPGEKIIEDLTFSDEVKTESTGRLARYESPQRITGSQLDGELLEDIKGAGFSKYNMQKAMWKWIPTK